MQITDDLQRIRYQRTQKSSKDEHFRFNFRCKIVLNYINSRHEFKFTEIKLVFENENFAFALRNVQLKITWIFGEIHFSKTLKVSGPARISFWQAYRLQRIFHLSVSKWFGEICMGLRTKLNLHCVVVQSALEDGAREIPKRPLLISFVSLHILFLLDVLYRRRK